MSPMESIVCPFKLHRRFDLPVAMRQLILQSMLMKIRVVFPPDCKSIKVICCACFRAYFVAHVFE